MSMDLSRLWERVEATPSDHLKRFDRGGFKGTAINPMQTIKRVTAIFGPVGHGWGYELTRSEVIQGMPVWADMESAEKRMLLGHEQVYVAHVRVWTVSRENFVDQIGQTTMVSFLRSNPQRGTPARFTTDEEAPKKAVTDAIMKALSHLGFGADVHLGLWDDSKYVNDRKAAEAEEARQEKLGLAQREAAAIIAAFAAAQNLSTMRDVSRDAGALAPHLVDLGQTGLLEEMRAAREAAKARLEGAANA